MVPPFMAQTADDQQLVELANSEWICFSWRWSCSWSCSWSWSWRSSFRRCQPGNNSLS